jgi:protein-L-isoaspartate(D-aspartate) O-methyltransferase
MSLLAPTELPKRRAQVALADRVARHSGVTDARILEAFRSVPREAFVPEELRDRAFLDQALPIGQGQTISQPSMIALMLLELACAPHHRVLEVGSGSGYAAALLSRLSCEVYGIERQPELALRAMQTLERAGVEGVTIREGDGTRGWPEHAPFDRILVSAGAPTIPEELLAELAPGGRLVMPVGGSSTQTLVTCERDAAGNLSYRSTTACIFVPLVSGEVAAASC